MRFYNKHIELPTPVAGTPCLHLANNANNVLSLDVNLWDNDVEVTVDCLPQKQTNGNDSYAVYGGFWRIDSVLLQINHANTDGPYQVGFHSNNTSGNWYEFPSGRITFRQTLNALYVNDELMTNITIGCQTGGDQLNLFSTTGGYNTGARISFVGKVYGVKVYKAGNLIYDLVPTIDEGTAGFKNIIDNTYLYPQYTNYTYEEEQ